MSALLHAADLAVHFGGTTAVDGVTITLREGTLHGLVGPNGSGKSTLLGALSRLTPVTRGSMAFDGTEYGARTPQQVARLGIRRTFQTVRLLPALTVLENVALGADARFAGRSVLRTWLDVSRTRRTEKLAREAAAAALDRMGLAPLADLRPGALSYGMTRRVEIARALAADPRVLLLDEPTAGMTRGERDEIGEILCSLRAEGLTQVLVEHDIPLITDVCDHLFVMNMGRLIAEGVPSEVVRLPEVQRAYLGRRHGDAA